MFCAVCGQKNENNASYCYNCGVSLLNRTHSKPTISYPRIKDSIDFGHFGKQMVKCNRCGQGIVGQVFKRTEYCGIFITRNYCSKCYHELLERKQNLWHPILLLTMFLILAIFLSFFFGII